MNATRMNTDEQIHPIIRVAENPRVKLEPELEVMLNGYTAQERLESAQRFERWARQIRLQLTLCTSDGRSFMPPKNVARIPEPRRWVRLQNN